MIVKQIQDISKDVVDSAARRYRNVYLLACLLRSNVLGSRVGHTIFSQRHLLACLLSE